MASSPGMVPLLELLSAQLLGMGRLCSSARPARSLSADARPCPNKPSSTANSLRRFLRHLARRAAENESHPDRAAPAGDRREPRADTHARMKLIVDGTPLTPAQGRGLKPRDILGVRELSDGVVAAGSFTMGSPMRERPIIAARAAATDLCRGYAHGHDFCAPAWTWF